MAAQHREAATSLGRTEEAVSGFTVALKTRFVANDNRSFETLALADTILAILPTDHPLAKKAKVRLADLASQFFIGMSAKTHPGAREWLAETCRAAGFAGRILQEADSETTVIQFVADGLGVALLPEQITGLPHEGVVFRPVVPPLRRESSIA